MMYALIVCVLAGAVLGVLKAKIASLFKAIIVGAAVVLIAAMLTIDAKFWGVVVMPSSSCFSCPGWTTARSSRSVTVPTGTNTSTVSL
jgi:hypothetical protein